jgi:integrase
VLQRGPTKTIDRQVETGEHLKLLFPQKFNFGSLFPHKAEAMLTDTKCKTATCPPGKSRARFYDAGGLYLEVSPAGSKRWFLKYRKPGMETRLALGSYPTVNLAAARIKQSEAKVLRHKGVDPIYAKKVGKLKAVFQADDTFEAIAREWHSKQISNWSPVHAKTVMSRMERDLFPWIGKRPMAQLHAMELMAALQKIEERQAIETAHRVLNIAKQVCDYWLPTADVAQRNITEGLKARLQPFRGKNLPAILEPKRVGEMMRAIKHYKGGMVVKVALQLTPLVYQRAGNVRMMEWIELDLEAATWTIPSAKMKRTVKGKEDGEDHVVPLPTQAVALLKSIQPLSGNGRYVFPGERNHDRPMSDNAVRSALYALGFGEEQKPHSFRTVARTLLVDELGLDPLMIEANLAHGAKDRLGRSYNRTQYIKQRFEMIQQWADYLESLASNVETSTLKESS